MFSEKMQKAIEEQINAEIWSAYLYLSMSAYFQRENLPGFANWMKIQWQEELTHALKFFDFVHERGGKVYLKPIDKVQTEWNSPADAFADTLKHEKEVTAMIDNLVDLAVAEKDHATHNMLQWYVAEQVEEEANASEILGHLERIGDKGHGLLMLDRELAARIFVDATKSAE